MIVVENKKGKKVSEGKFVDSFSRASYKFKKLSEREILEGDNKSEDCKIFRQSQSLPPLKYMLNTSADIGKMINLVQIRK